MIRLVTCFKFFSGCYWLEPLDMNGPHTSSLSIYISLYQQDTVNSALNYWLRRSSTGFISWDWILNP